MRRVLFLAVLTLAALPVLAIGKVSVDPNTPGKSAAVEGMVQDGDPRLAKRINGYAPQITVAQLCEAITRFDGVVARAGRNSNDWQVRDRRLSIFANGATLGELMNSVARVMKFKWERSGEPGKWSYRIYMDRRTLLDAEAQRARAEEKLATELARKRKSTFEKYMELSDLTLEQKTKLRHENPFLYLCAQAGLGDGMSTFFRQIPAAADAIVNGGRMELTGDTLSPIAQASLIRFMSAVTITEANFNPRAKDRIIPNDISSSGFKLGINTNSDFYGGNEPAPFLGQITFSYDSQQFDIPIIDPDGDLAALLGKVAIEGEMAGGSSRNVVEDHWSEFSAVLTKSVAADYGGEAPNVHPDDPTLGKEIDFTIGWSSVPDAEKDLADKTRLSIVSDYFPGPGLSPAVGYVAGGKMATKDALNRFADAYIYNWDRRGSVIELRDRNWFKKRAAQIPDAWLERWRRELKTDGTLGLGSLSDLARLTGEQIAANITPDSALGPYSSLVQVNRELLRFYGALTEGHQRMLTGAGLDLSHLTDTEMEAAAVLLQSRNPRLLQSPVVPVTLVLTGKQEEKQVDYVFSAVPESDGQPVRISFTVQRYKQPQNVPKTAGS